MPDVCGKVKKAIEEQLIGNYIFSDEENKNLTEIISKQLQEYDSGRGNSIYQSSDEAVFVVLVNIIKPWDSKEDTFWGFINKKLLGKDSSPKVYRYLTSLIDRLGEKRKILILDKCQKKYYATILAHAFAPLRSTKAFLELCWKIYCDDLEMNYSTGDKIYSQIANQLKMRLGSDIKEDDDFKLGSQVYSFRAGIKGLAISAPKPTEYLIDETVGKIDKLFRGGLLDTSKYYNKIIYSWWTEKEDSFSKAPDRRERLERPVSDYSNIKAKYLRDNEKARLYIPAIRLVDNLDISPILTLKIDGAETINEEMHTKGSGLSMATVTRSFDLDDFHFASDTIDVEVEISHCGNIIYCSGKSLKRSVIVFKDNREVFATECPPGNYSMFLLNLEKLLQCPAEPKNLSRNFYVFTAHEEDVLQSDTKTIIFSSEQQKHDLYFKMRKRNDILLRKDDRDYIVIDGDLDVVAAEGLNVSDYGVRYGKTYFNMTDFSHVEHPDGIYYSITEILIPGEPTTIDLFRYSNNKTIAEYGIVKFNDIQINYDREIYYDINNKGTVHFLTGNFDETFQFDAAQDEISVSLLKYPDSELILFPPILRWKIDDENPRNCCDENGIWYKELTNSSILTLELPPTMNADVRLSDTLMLMRDSNKPDVYKFGQAIYSLFYQPNRKKETDLFVVLNNQKKYQLTKVFFEEQFKNEKSPLVMRGHKEILWNPKDIYAGDKDANFELTFFQEQNKFKSLMLHLDQELIDLSEYPEGYYTIRVDLITHGAFSNKCITLHTQKICIGDERNFKYKNYRFYIDQVMILDEARPKEIKPFYIDNLKFLYERDSYDFYSGDIFIITYNGGKIYCNSMKDDRGKKVRVNPVRIEMRNDNSCWLVSGYKENAEIDFDSEFTLEYNDIEKPKISKKDRGTFGVDYYYIYLQQGAI